MERNAPLGAFCMQKRLAWTTLVARALVCFAPSIPYQREPTRTANHHHRLVAGLRAPESLLEKQTGRFPGTRIEAEFDRADVLEPWTCRRCGHHELPCASPCEWNRQQHPDLVYPKGDGRQRQQGVRCSPRRHCPSWAERGRRTAHAQPRTGQIRCASMPSEYQPENAGVRTAEQATAPRLPGQPRAAFSLGAALFAVYSVTSRHW